MSKTRVAFDARDEKTHGYQMLLIRQHIWKNLSVVRWATGSAFVSVDLPVMCRKSVAVPRISGPIMYNYSLLPLRGLGLFMCMPFAMIMIDIRSV